jgi:hypothetical protein
MAPDPVSLRGALEGRLTDTRKPRGKRHELASLVSVLAAGVAAAHSGPLAVAQAAAIRWHGCRLVEEWAKRRLTSGTGRPLSLIAYRSEVDIRLARWYSG